VDNNLIASYILFAGYSMTFSVRKGLIDFAAFSK